MVPQLNSLLRSFIFHTAKKIFFKVVKKKKKVIGNLTFNKICYVQLLETEMFRYH